MTRSFIGGGSFVFVLSVNTEKNKAMKDSTKITLTIGQLRKLVKEASEETDTANKPDDGKADVPEFEIKDGELTKYNGPGGNVVIPKGVTVISGRYEKQGLFHGEGYHGAFEDCKELASVRIPNGVEKIDDGAFRNCENLAKAVLPDTLTKIGDEAFRSCHGLKRIVLPDSLTKIGREAFAFSGLSGTMRIPASVDYIGKEAMAYTRLKSVSIENPYASIGNDAFGPKVIVVKGEENMDSLAAVAVRQLLAPHGDSNCGYLDAQAWRRGNDNSIFVRVKINGKEHEFEVGRAKEFGDKVRKGVVDAGGTILDSEEHGESSGGWYSGYTRTLFSIPTKARKFGKTCHEWDVLVKIVDRYSGFKLDPMKCRYGRTSGKRGRLDEPDEWEYIAFDHPEWLQKAIEWIQKAKTARDTLKVEEMKGEQCDDRDHSSYYETECYGSMIETYKFSVITPSGKVKNTYVLGRDGYWHDS